MKKIIIICILTIFLISNFIFTEEENMRLAIMDLQGISVNPNIAKTVSDILRTELFNTKLFTIIERTQMDKILKEQGFQQSGCTGNECAVQIGKLLSAKKVLVGTVNKLGDSYIINARIIDVEHGIMEFAENTKVESESELDTCCKTFAQKLANRINEGTIYIEDINTIFNKATTNDLSKKFVKVFEKNNTINPDKAIFTLNYGDSISTCYDVLGSPQCIFRDKKNNIALIYANKISLLFDSDCKFKGIQFQKWSLLHMGGEYIEEPYGINIDTLKVFPGYEIVNNYGEIKKILNIKGNLDYSSTYQYETKKSKIVLAFYFSPENKDNKNQYYISAITILKKE